MPAPELGPLTRPLLITVILRLRPELNARAVEEAVERMLTSGEEPEDLTHLWEEVNAAMAALQLSAPSGER